MIPLAKDRPITLKGVRAFLLWSFLTKRDTLTYPLFCEVRDSFAKEDFAAALGTVPQLEEVPYASGEPEFDGFNDFRLDWVNRVFKLRVSLSREILDFDLTGQTRKILDSISARVANWPELLFYTRLQAAEASPSIESGMNGNSTIYFFSASHAWYSGQTAMVNLFTGNTTPAFVAGTTPATVAVQLQADFNTALAYLRSFKDDKGQPFHPTEIDPQRLVIVCSPKLAIPMNIAFGAQVINQTTNMFRGTVRIISSPYLPASGTDSCDWYLFYLTPNGNRPFLYSRFRRISDEQIEDFMSVNTDLGGGRTTFDGEMLSAMREFSSVEIQSNLASRGTRNEADVILNDRFLLGARWMGEIVPQMWPMAVKVVND